MRWSSLSGGVEFVLLILAQLMAHSAEAQPEPEKIPLKEIWAYNMPGTLDIRKLEPDKFGDAVKKLNSAEQVQLYKESLISQSLEPLRPLTRGQTTKPGFAVVGTGIAALREAHAVMARDKKPRDSIPVNIQVSIVFFSYPFGSYVHLRAVERRDHEIQIQYSFVPHDTRELTVHFALIPVGEFSQGEVRVKMVCLPMEKRYLDAGFRQVDKKWESQVVCQPFQFVIKGDNAD